MKTSDGEGSDSDLGDDEELFQQALDVLKSTKRASTSMIQRRLRIGYNRAARIMDLMEDKGIVGPENGSSPARFSWTSIPTVPAVRPDAAGVISHFRHFTLSLPVQNP
jgi:DNA segregation ATPase FtsK/SpoIIIE-like protein